MFLLICTLTLCNALFTSCLFLRFCTNHEFKDECFFRRCRRFLIISIILLILCATFSIWMANCIRLFLIPGSISLARAWVIWWFLLFTFNKFHKNNIVIRSIIAWQNVDLKYCDTKYFRRNSLLWPHNIQVRIHIPFRTVQIEICWREHFSECITAVLCAGQFITRFGCCFIIMLFILKAFHFSRTIWSVSVAR